MIELRKSFARRHVRRGLRERWMTFDDERPRSPSCGAFEVLTKIDEDRIPPRGGFSSYPTEEAEMVTYVYRGDLAQSDTVGNSFVVRAGEFQRLRIRHGIRRTDTNTSQTDWVHFFRISLRPADSGLSDAGEQRQFPAAERHNVFCIVASPDGREGSLRVSEDVLVYSAIVDAGRHLVHEMQPGRNAWLHLISGKVTLQDVVMTPGDSVSATSERSVALTAQEDTELLLVDVGPASRSPAGTI